MTRLYFELESYDRYHRASWENNLASWFNGAVGLVRRVNRPADAEFIIEPAAAHSFINGRVFTVAPDSHYRTHPENTFAWDAGDHPTGRLPGLFCSLSKRLVDPARHRGFCYPLRINHLIKPCALNEAKYLFGFSGNITAPVRFRLFTELANEAKAGRGLLRQTESIFTRIYNPATDADRMRFVDDLRQCRFILCPRGNGFSSIRLFETMEAKRVPVIISDNLQLPQCVNWHSCAVVVPESDIARIPELLSSREEDWPRLANNARSEWERCFDDRTLLSSLVAEVQAIRAARNRRENMQRIFHPFRVLPEYTLVRAKAFARRLQSLKRSTSGSHG